MGEGENLKGENFGEDKSTNGGSLDEDGKLDYRSLDEDGKLDDGSLEEDGKMNDGSLEEDGKLNDGSLEEDGKMNDGSLEEDGKLNDGSLEEEGKLDDGSLKEVLSEGEHLTGGSSDTDRELLDVSSGSSSMHVKKPKHRRSDEDTELAGWMTGKMSKKLKCVKKPKLQGSLQDNLSGYYKPKSSKRVVKPRKT